MDKAKAARIRYYEKIKAAKKAEVRKGQPPLKERLAKLDSEYHLGTTK